MREKGLDVWIEDQEERKKTGFCYSDIRNEPCNLPE